MAHGNPRQINPYLSRGFDRTFNTRAAYPYRRHPQPAADPRTKPYKQRRARAVARLMLGAGVEEVAEALDLELEEVCELAERVAVEGWCA